MATLTSCKWICLRLNQAFIKRHVLVLTEYADLKYLGFEMYKYYEYVLFKFQDDAHICKAIEANNNYCMQIFKSADDMRDIRLSIKSVFNISVLGHIFTLTNRPPMYSFLKEWYVLPHSIVDSLRNESLVCDFPHVVVFDLDSTLITEEQQVRIRDNYVYDSLRELQLMGCVLVLWSYGSRDHVAHSMRDLKLESYFEIIISEGAVAALEKPPLNAIGSNVFVDYNLKKQFIENKFNLDLSDTAVVPKSPKVVIKYLCDKSIHHFKSITLVDDLPTNNYAYDFYVKVARCPTPVRDWEHYHNSIVHNIDVYDAAFI
ncbi:38k [Cyclophragma undans nucleopolyhedrovirus]|uniref:38k n=1 Tax=Cyclophragma undans nucleopolyhedrovirus TaxID=1906244 RepID=A0A288Q7I5_9ABAC|nr:38k [Cyclophragma undans nucleopolyhedrovirus]AOT85530.1 38k [Cyclophragma undans nucleopolyhedrovirus]